MVDVKLDTLVAPVITGLLGAGGMGGMWAWLNERAKTKAGTPAAMTGAAAAFQKYLNESFEHYVDGLKSDIEVLKREIIALKAENLVCKNDGDQLKQIVESLESFLRREGIDVPQRKLDRTFTVIDKDGTTTMRADSAEDAPPTKPYRPRTRRKS